MKNPSFAAWSLLLAAALGCSGVPDDPQARLATESYAPTYYVLEVYDGNTIGVDLNRNGVVDVPDEKVLLTGVAAPAYSSERSEYLADRAIAYLKEKLFGQRVGIEDDRKEGGLYRQEPPPEFNTAGEGFADGGSLLAYAYVGDTLVNADLIERGLARVREEIPCKKMDLLRAAETRARGKRVGIWEVR
ncbi:MAG: thermonuclease family protein [Planctomycetales bacterium]|nr:thermonuclease family protein [Planctomycetales bacterium]